jgi:undecaprenyl-diphosphatase
MPTLFSLDRIVFLALNHMPHTDVSNGIAEFFSGIGEWGAVWFIIALVLFFREERRDHWFFLPTLWALGFGVLISEFLLKNIIARSRPMVEFGAIVVSGATNYSFPSTHATLAFAMAYVLSKEEPNLRVLFYLLAGLISLSRIYLGVHYPTDIIGGALLGLAIGWIALWVEKSIPHST